MDGEGWLWGWIGTEFGGDGEGKINSEVPSAMGVLLCR